MMLLIFTAVVAEDSGWRWCVFLPMIDSDGTLDLMYHAGRGKTHCGRFDILNLREQAMLASRVSAR